MKMTPQRRALDKIYKRRDRYEIPEWQRGEVWDATKKQQLIDSILRGWRLPKFYFVRNSEDEYEVVDGQQRLTAIYEFFANELGLAADSTAQFGGPYYKDLKPKFSDAFDDYEIDYDEVEEATEAELKQFFQRLQQGLPLTSSEKLNSVHSKLRDFCRSQTKHDFLKNSIVVADTRLAHFDILSKAAVIEIEGIETGLRYDDIKPVFEAQSNFSPTSAVGKRLRAALDFLSAAFPKASPLLKNRTVVQSIISLACRLVATGNSAGLEKRFADFVQHFMSELSHQVELGQAATDYDFIRFQKSINANVKAGARTRQEILLRKAFMHDLDVAAAFDPSALIASGLTGRVRELGEAIAAEISRLNTAYAAGHGKDLFKATNKTVPAVTNLGKPIKDLTTYKALISDLYFVFRESIGQRLGETLPSSFNDVNVLRTDLQHDTDHGDKAKIKAKKTQAGSVFKKYSGDASPDVLDPTRFVLVQANILSALELDLKNLALPKP
ncbi:MAG: DUF262 domain-containing protein [Gammaproteobacteria bacterium]|nr:DUF262 domain-containing protein [Gammaproteobacteria bacterium]